MKGLYAADGGLAPLTRAVEKHAARGALEDYFLARVSFKGEAFCGEFVSVQCEAELGVDGAHVLTRWAARASKSRSAAQSASRASGKGASAATRTCFRISTARPVTRSTAGLEFVSRSGLRGVHGL